MPENIDSKDDRMEAEEAEDNHVKTEKEKILLRSIDVEMKHSYIDYAMSVIVGRALPDVRDGLKPVHRRILFGMHELGVYSDKPYKKSARIVGDVLGKYHPHGDVAVYDALVRMAQDFSYRYPLISGQGNFGSIDGDSAAAMRYTEVRMAKISEELLADIEKETVDFADNFDGSLKEPVILPAKLPNLLINGSSGIAVGMATNIPPHNLGEVVDAIVMQIDNPEVSLNEMMTVIKGPDFPTGAEIHGRKGIESAYLTGRGSIKVRSKIRIEAHKGRKSIIVTEIPYLINKSELVKSIASVVQEKKIEGIADLRDESSKAGIRIVIELKPNSDEKVVLNQLYKHTQLQTTFGIINLALVDGRPKILSLKELISEYIKHRQIVVRRREEYKLKKAEARVHILEGFQVALENIDAVVKILKGSDTVENVFNLLTKTFNLSEEQVKAILNMRLQQLTKLERNKIQDELDSLKKDIALYKDILSSESKILEVIKKELLEIKEKYADKRRTEIFDEAKELDVEDLIPNDRVVITRTREGYIKRCNISVYKIQKRGGRGVKSMATKEEDIVENLCVANNHDYILFFTDKGKVYWLKAYKIPEGTKQSKGKALINLINLNPNEKVTNMIPITNFNEGFLLMATEKGMVKKTEISEYSNPRTTGIIAIKLTDKDKLIEVKKTSGNDYVLLVTKNGKSIKFSEKDVRTTGRSSQGVRGIRLKKDDKVVSMVLADESAQILTATEKGYGKRTPLSEYRIQKRGGQGIIDIKTGERNGCVIGAKIVHPGDEVSILSSNGTIIKMKADDIRMTRRNTMGVRLMRVDEGAKLTAIEVERPEK